MTYTLDSKINELLQNHNVRALLENYVPGATSNPMLLLAGGMTIRAMTDMPQARQMGLTKEMVDKFLVEANKLT